MRARGIAPAGLDAGAAGPPRSCSEALDDAGFLALERSYQRSGGLATCEQISVLIRVHDTQPVSTLAHWIVAEDVVHFGWHGLLMLPLFQFARPSVTPLPEVACVITEWQGALDPLALARWFANAHALLGGEAPADAMQLHAPAVVLAARADRCALRH